MVEHPGGKLGDKGWGREVALGRAVIQCGSRLSPIDRSLYLSKWQNVFVQIAKYICPNCKMNLSKFPPLLNYM